MCAKVLLIMLNFNLRTSVLAPISSVKFHPDRANSGKFRLKHKNPTKLCLAYFLSLGFEKYVKISQIGAKSLSNFLSSE